MQYLFWPVLRFLTPRQRIWYLFYRQLDRAFREFDNRRIQIVDHVRLIPPARYRTGGQSALSEYGYSAGLMAAYIGEHITTRNPQVLDLGCGTGKMVSAAWPFLGQTGHYTGLDISKKVIDFARQWYPPERCTFIHAPLYNAHYNPDGIPLTDYQLPLEQDAVDLALAFSLFTHLNQPDATFYFRELARVMKRGAVALFTFFLLDERYNRPDHIGTRWNFDRTLDGQPEWYYSSWFTVPERQIAVTQAGIVHLMENTFELKQVYKGWWTGQPGAFLQDTLVFRRR